MPARDIPELQGRFLQAVFWSDFEGNVGYFLAVSAVAAVFVIPLALQGVLGSTVTFIFFVPAILVAAIARGIGPGPFALVLTLVGALYFAGTDASSWVQSSVFGVVGLASTRKCPFHPLLKAAGNRQIYACAKSGSNQRTKKRPNGSVRRWKNSNRLRSSGRFCHAQTW